jgi:hypothetical protein
MPPLTYIHASEATRCRTCGGGIVGNASKRCNAGAVTLGSVTHYEAARTTAGGWGVGDGKITPPYRP